MNKLKKTLCSTFLFLNMIAIKTCTFAAGVNELSDTSNTVSNAVTNTVSKGFFYNVKFYMDNVVWPLIICAGILGYIYYLKLNGPNDFSSDGDGGGDE